MRKNQFLKVKNCLLELEKDFIEQKDIELKDRNVKTKKEIIVYGKKEIKKIRPTKNTWYDWLINFFPEPIRKSVDGFKDKIVSLFKTNTLISYMKREQKKKKKKEQNN